LVVDVEDMQLEPRRALPLGLIVNEFIVNSLKHAFDHANGTIGIRLKAGSPGTVRLTLWDDGKGLPQQRDGGLGMQLIEGFAQQIGAAVEWDSDHGTRLTLTLQRGQGEAPSIGNAQPAGNAGDRLPG
jgi:two-component sensor histidine kinase